eukprot:2225579-Pleurochrysis_carterae.AAC.2
MVNSVHVIRGWSSFCTRGGSALPISKPAKPEHHLAKRAATPKPADHVLSLPAGVRASEERVGSGAASSVDSTMLVAAISTDAAADATASLPSSTVLEDAKKDSATTAENAQTGSATSAPLATSSASRQASAALSRITIGSKTRFGTKKLASQVEMMAHPGRAASKTAEATLGRIFCRAQREEKRRSMPASDDGNAMERATNSFLSAMSMATIPPRDAALRADCSSAGGISAAITALTSRPKFARCFCNEESARDVDRVAGGAVRSSRARAGAGVAGSSATPWRRRRLGSNLGLRYLRDFGAE